VGGLHDCEVPTIERRHRQNPEALGRSHDRGVDRSQGQIAVLPDELADSQPVAGAHRLYREGAPGDIAEKPDFRVRTDASRQQIRDLGDRQDGDDQRARMRLEEPTTGVVMAVVGIDVSVERSGVNEERYRPASLARISSIRMEMSSWPLAPAAAAPNLRLGPIRK
jgi:hypothetical protein